MGPYLIATAGGVRDTVESMADTHDQIILALIAVVATSVAALVWTIRNGRYSKAGAEQASAANAAVNNVGPGSHTLYDMVKSIRDDVEELKRDRLEFDGHGWDRLPPDLADAVSLTSTIRSMQAIQEHCADQLAVVLRELRDHVEWEMTTKYGKDD